MTSKQLFCGCAWVGFIMTGVFIGDSPLLLDRIPTWLLIGMVIAPFTYIATLAARAK